PAALQVLCDSDGVLGRCREMGTEPNPALDCSGDRWVRVALSHRAEAVVEVEQLVAVDIPDPCPLAAVEIDRPRLAELVRGGDAAGERRARALVQRPRHRRPLVQRPLLALGQLANTLAVDLARRLDGHRATLTRSTAYSARPWPSARHEDRSEAPKSLQRGRTVPSRHVPQSDLVPGTGTRLQRAVLVRRGYRQRDASAPGRPRGARAGGRSVCSRRWRSDSGGGNGNRPGCAPRPESLRTGSAAGVGRGDP